MSPLGRTALAVLAKAANGGVLSPHEREVLRDALLARSRRRQRTSTTARRRQRAPEARILWGMLKELQPKDAIEAIREYLSGLAVSRPEAPLLPGIPLDPVRRSLSWPRPRQRRSGGDEQARASRVGARRVRRVYIEGER